MIRAVLLVCAAVVAACTAGPEMSQSPSGPLTLAGTSWRAVSVAGAAPVAGHEPTLTFTTDEINGSTGCNQYFGGYTYWRGTIKLSNVGMTLIGCDKEIGAIEGKYTQALNASTSASFEDGGQLVIDGRGGQLLFAPAPR